MMYNMHNVNITVMQFVTMETPVWIIYDMHNVILQWCNSLPWKQWLILFTCGAKISTNHCTMDLTCSTIKNACCISALVYTVGAIDIETHSFTSSPVKYGFYIDLSIWKPYFTGLEVEECVSISIAPTVHHSVNAYDDYPSHWWEGLAQLYCFNKFNEGHCVCDKSTHCMYVLTVLSVLMKDIVFWQLHQHSYLSGVLTVLTASMKITFIVMYYFDCFDSFDDRIVMLPPFWLFWQIW